MKTNGALEGAKDYRKVNKKIRQGIKIKRNLKGQFQEVETCHRINSNKA